MSYGNDFSNKPYEKASKNAHINIINDIQVKEFLSKCHIPPFQENIANVDFEKIFIKSITITLLKISSQLMVDIQMFLLKGISIFDYCVFPIWRFVL